jgi:hypothetical protein
MGLLQVLIIQQNASHPPVVGNTLDPPRCSALKADDEQPVSGAAFTLGPPISVDMVDAALLSMRGQRKRPRFWRGLFQEPRIGSIRQL